VLIVNLRLLGMDQVGPYAAVYQLLPIGMLGFAINLVTGMLFFVGSRRNTTANPVFYWKIRLRAARRAEHDAFHARRRCVARQGRQSAPPRGESRRRRPSSSGSPSVLRPHACHSWNAF